MAASLGWTHEPFDIPVDLLDRWRAVGQRGAPKRRGWIERVDRHDRGAEFRARLRHPVSAQALADLADVRANAERDAPVIATRAANKLVLDALVERCPGLVGGSADLRGSNGVAVAATRSFTATDRTGNFIDYGIREHAMVAAMNGIALHGGFVPFGATFLVFSDYARPSLRLAALMGLPVIAVFTHDSIGVGEDGPTHQPVEHLCALRSIPNLQVIRPADAVETIDAWTVALTELSRPTVLALTRQAVQPLSRPSTGGGTVADGAYRLVDPPEPAVTLIASGSEVGLAVRAAAQLATESVSAAVVSMPCMERFAARPAAEQGQVLGASPRLAIEAGVGQSWHRWLRPGDRFVGVETFGASAPGAVLFEHFGLTPDRIRDAALELVEPRPNPHQNAPETVGAGASTTATGSNR